MNARHVFASALPALVLFAAGPRVAGDGKTPRELLDEGAAAYRSVDLVGADRALEAAAVALGPEAASDPKLRKLASQVHLFRARVAVVAERPEIARQRFREALRLDPQLRLSPETDPPKILGLFEDVRAELAGEPAEAPEDRSTPEAEPVAEDALSRARGALEAGRAAYRALDLRTAEAELARAAELLGPFEALRPEARGLAARVRLQLGRVAAVAGRTEEAKQRFVAALDRDAALRLDPHLDPPKLLELFESAQADHERARLASLPWWQGHPRETAGAGAGIALLILLLLLHRHRARNRPPALAGKWSLAKTLVANNAGAANGRVDLEMVTVRQRGAELSVVTEDERPVFSATVSGGSVRFAGSVVDLEAGKELTRTYSGEGRVLSRLIEGSLTVVVTRDVQTHGFQFQSMSRYDYTISMTRR
jgi:hypothetical protein